MMESDESDLSKPEFWLSKSPDRMVLSLISMIFRYWQMINTLLLILKSDPNLKDIRLQNGEKIGTLLDNIEQRHKLFYSNTHAASNWIQAYKDGEIDLEPYRSPYDNNQISDNET